MLVMLPEFDVPLDAAVPTVEGVHAAGEGAFHEAFSTDR